MLVLAALRRFNVHIFANEVLPAHSLRKELAVLPFCDIDAMVEDYENVVAAAQSAQSISFWNSCPSRAWSRAAKKALLLLPTSAPCERGFSVIGALFNDRRQS